MLFSSLEFVYGFLPLTLFGYYVLPWRFKNIALLLSSLVFYYYGGQNSILIMLLIIAVNYFAAIKIEAGRRNGSSKIYLIAGAGVSLICLAVFKYADFFIGNINAAFGLKLPLPGLALPIGISFYTFQALSYIADVYRGNVTAQKNPVKLAAYISFFPQLIAGPIVRYTDIAPRLDRRENTAERFAEGISRFVIGLGKKVLLANVLYSFCQVFKAQSAPASLFFWIYAISYSLHLYYDFSGYSDMAIGLGKMFGFDLPENFNYPFAAVSISDFWRRWHITLADGFVTMYIFLWAEAERVR